MRGGFVLDADALVGLKSIRRKKTKEVAPPREDVCREGNDSNPKKRALKESESQPDDLGKGNSLGGEGSF